MDGRAGECGSGRGGSDSEVNESFVLSEASESAMLRWAAEAAAAELVLVVVVAVVVASSGDRTEPSRDLVLSELIIEIRLNSAKREVAKGRVLSPSNLFTAFSTRSLNSSVLRS